MTVYFIPGIGADSRVFKHLRLPEGYHARYLSWLPPAKNESIPNYAERLAAAIDPSEPFVLIGLSLGGIVAVEISKQIPPTITVIIGSVPLSAQLPPYYHLAGRIPLLKFLPPAFFKCTASLKRLVTKERFEDKIDLIRMIWKGDTRFIRWGMQAVLHWQNTVLPDPFYHLHGTRDEVFPVRFVNPTHIVPGGGHMLCLTHPAEVNRIVAQILP